MCLIAFALHAHPQLTLLLASNRDETYDRPTAPLRAWTTAQGTRVLAGQDLKDGGTWIGVTPEGRVALLTNVREPPSNSCGTLRSRGELITRWLEGIDWPDTATAAATLKPSDYGGFNLIIGHVHQKHWLWLNNRPDWVAAGMPSHWASQLQRPQAGLATLEIGPGIYGLSNAGLDTPWPKTTALKQALARSLDSAPAAAPWTCHAGNAGLDGQQRQIVDSESNFNPSWLNPVWSNLADRRLAPDHALPNTGVAPEWEKGLSAPFVHMPLMRYGTRSSLVIAAWRESADVPAPGHHLHLLEKTHQQEGSLAPTEASNPVVHLCHRVPQPKSHQA